MEYPEDLITVRNTISNDTNRKKIIQVFCVLVGESFSLELLVDAIGGLDPMRNLDDRKSISEIFSDHFLGFFYEKILLTSESIELSPDFLVCFWLEMLEALGLEHFLESEDTESISDRSIDIQSLESDPSSLLRSRMMLEGLHIMEAIGELHDDHSHISDHCEEHLSEAPDRPIISTVLDRFELRETLTDLCDIFSEIFLDILLRVGGVLDHIMEDTRLDRDDIRLHDEEYSGSLERVSDIGLT